MEKILTKYPDRVPVVIESKVCGDETVLKLMVPRDRTMGSMIVQLRNKIKTRGPNCIIKSLTGFLSSSPCYCLCCWCY
jgi:hypothetical protein